MSEDNYPQTVHIQHRYGFDISDYGVKGKGKRARIFTLGYGEPWDIEAVEETEADAKAALAQRIRDRMATLGEMLEIVEGIKLDE